ncbi:MAG: proton-conducting transporter membrane subunit [Pseudomonadota bacterium]
MFDVPLLSLLILINFPGLFLIAITADDRPYKRQNIRLVALLSSIFSLTLVLFAFFSFDEASSQVQLLENFALAPYLGALGLHGVSLLFILSTALLLPICILSLWKTGPNDSIKGQALAFVAISAANAGVYLSTTALSFFLFFSLAVFIVFMVIADHERSQRASAFSGLIVVSLLALSVAFAFVDQSVGTTAFIDLNGDQLGTAAQAILWTVLALSFALLLPVWPIHEWYLKLCENLPLPSVLLVALFLPKLGIYGLLQFNVALFPSMTENVQTPVMLFFAASGAVSALFMVRETNMHRLVGLVSISLLSCAAAAVFSTNASALQGAQFALFSHGFVIAGLFACAHFMVQRIGAADISAFGGIVNNLPFFTSALFLLMLAAISAPFFPTSVASLTILIGLFDALAAAGLILCIVLVILAISLLRKFQRIALGSLEKENLKSLADLKTNEAIVILPIIVILFALWAGSSSLMEISSERTSAIIAEYRFSVEDKIEDSAPMQQELN